MSSPAVSVTTPLAPPSLLPDALRPSPPFFFCRSPPPQQWSLPVLSGAGGVGGEGGGGRRRGRSVYWGGQVCIAASPGTRSSSRRCRQPCARDPRPHPGLPLPGAHRPGETRLSVSYLHLTRGRSILALPCSHFILRCFAGGWGVGWGGGLTVPTLGLRGLVVV